MCSRLRRRYDTVDDGQISIRHYVQHPKRSLEFTLAFVGISVMRLHIQLSCKFFWSRASYRLQGRLHLQHPACKILRPLDTNRQGLLLCRSREKLHVNLTSDCRPFDEGCIYPENVSNSSTQDERLRTSLESLGNRPGSWDDHKLHRSGESLAFDHW